MTIDVAIISQFRSKFLKKCLASLQEQSRLPDHVVLVLHSQDKSSKELIKRFKNISFLVKFYDQRGFAPLRNIVLRASKSDFLYFVDDDCILSPGAVKKAEAFLLKYKQYAAVQGKTKNIDTSFYSQFAQWTNDLWLERLWDEKKRALASLDTKNVCLRKKSVESFSFFECLGSEDVDFGLQITAHGGKIGYERKMLVYHCEQANDLVAYFLKRLRMAKGLAILKKKWGKLPIFYQKDKNFNKKITDFFQKSPYYFSWKYRIIFRIFLLFRSIRFVWE